MKSRILALAALAAAMVFAGSSTAEASYSYTVSETSISTLNYTTGLTTVTFDPSVLPASAGITSNFVVATVGATSMQTGTPNSGSTSFTEVMNVTDSIGNTEMFELTGTLNLLNGSELGIATTFTNASISVLSTSGNAFGISFAGYAPPTAGTPATGLSNGALSILVIPPAVVPEPASIAMLGLGLGAIVAVRRFRRRAI